MKQFFLVLAVGLCAADLLAQGSIVFDNGVPGQVVAPVFGPETAPPYNRKTGNPPDGFPSGSTLYTGPRLAGNGFTAQLWAAPLPDQPEAALLPVSAATTTFGTGTGAGFVVPVLAPVVIPGAPAGGVATLQLRAWENRGGAVVSWAQALADPTMARGFSELFNSLPLGAGQTYLAGLRSFSLVRPSDLPEPSPLALFVVGLMPLFLGRRWR
jgi:hypothetical protein